MLDGPGFLLAIALRGGSLGPLLLTALAIMGSPGPATISLTAAGSNHGVRRSLGLAQEPLVQAVVGVRSTLDLIPPRYRWLNRMSFHISRRVVVNSEALNRHLTESCRIAPGALGSITSPPNIRE